MTNEQPPSHFPHYCMLCGARLIYTEISKIAVEVKVSWRCSGCGKEQTGKWSEITFSTDDQGDQSSPDIQVTSPISEYMLMPPPPPPSSYFDDPEDSPMNQEESARAFQEHQMQYMALHQQFETAGIAGIVRAAHFPLFALNDLRERFPFKSCAWGGGWPKAESAGVVTSFGLTYAGPDYQNVTERIVIEQEDRQSHPRLHHTTDKSETFDAHRIVRILANLPDPEAPDMQALCECKAIYQYVNLDTVRRAPIVHASIKLQSGESASWAIQRYNAPLPIAYAHAQIEDTMIDVGMIGPAAEEIESLLGEWMRLTPESVALDQLNLALKAWAEYVQRRFQS